MFMDTPPQRHPNSWRTQFKDTPGTSSTGALPTACARLVRRHPQDTSCAADGQYQSRPSSVRRACLTSADASWCVPETRIENTMILSAGETPRSLTAAPTETSSSLGVAEVPSTVDVEYCDEGWTAVR